MEQFDWVSEFCGAVTVCDVNGLILFMNRKSIETFEKYGGEKLVGTSLLDCHPEPSKTVLKNMLETQKSNSYTIEKNGIKKLIYQTPWFKNNEYQGFVELSLEIPIEMPHFIRK